MDQQNPFEYLVQVIALSIPAHALGRMVDRTVGPRNIAIRIGVNALALYCVSMLVPGGVDVTTMPGLLAAFVFFNSQRWA